MVRLRIRPYLRKKLNIFVRLYSIFPPSISINLQSAALSALRCCFHLNSLIMIAELRMLQEYISHGDTGRICNCKARKYDKHPLEMKQPIPNLDLPYTVKLRGIGRIISDFCSFKASRSLEGKGLMPIGLSIQLHFIDRKVKKTSFHGDTVIFHDCRRIFDCHSAKIDPH